MKRDELESSELQETPWSTPSRHEILFGPRDEDEDVGGDEDGDEGDDEFEDDDLEFDDDAKAEAFRAALRELWGRVQGQGLIESPRARILETAESKEY